MPDRERTPLDKIRGFFKSGTELGNLVDVPELPVSALEGVDDAAAKALESSGVKTISDLAQVDPLPKVPGIDQVTLEKWVRVCSLLVNYAEFPAQQKKVLLVGLDNAGKTSLLAALQDKYSGIRNLLPTRGLSREVLDFFGFPIVSWDLGGQLVYREKLYFAKPELFFADADLVMFVVDVQDFERYDEALEYFRQILAALEELRESPKLMVVFHKLDPDIRDDPTVTSQRNKLVAEFTKSKRNFNLIFVSTTIYDKVSVERAFSSAFREIATPTELVRHVLETFAKRVEARAVAMVTDAGFVFDSYGRDEVDEEVNLQTCLVLQSLRDLHVKALFSKEPDAEGGGDAGRFVLCYEDRGLYFTCETVRDLDGKPMFVWVMTDRDPADAAAKMGALKEEIIPVMNFFL
ncbi:MAG: hypothetical protein Kow0069_35900 [Promethearchaeota archaeon]